MSSFRLWIESVLECAEVIKSDLIKITHQLHDTQYDIYLSDKSYATLCQANISSISNNKLPIQTVQLFCLDASDLGINLPVWPQNVFERSQMQQAFSEIGFRGHYLHEPRTWQFYSPSKKIGVQLVAENRKYAPWDSGAPLRNFMHWGLSHSSRQICHAASLGFNGRGVLFGGAGGSGKSGTTLSGVIHGLSSVGDDYVLIENDMRTKAYPLFKIFKQDQRGVNRICPQLAGNFGELNWQDKYEIHSSKLGNHYLFPDVLDICAIVIPRIVSAKKSSFVEITKAQAMRALAPSSSFQLPDGERESLSFLAQLCRSLPCYELGLSGDPEEISSSIRSFLF